MELIQKFIEQIKMLITWWIIVTPWEKGIIVRFGKKVKSLSAGIHFKIPMFDKVYIQTVRSRNVASPIQTVTTKDGTVISISLIIQYSVSDIYKLYNTLYHPEMTIQNMVMGCASDYISKEEFKNCSVEKIMNNIKLVSLIDFGVQLEQVSIATYAVVKTFRLIQDSSYIHEGYKLDDFK